VAAPDVRLSMPARPEGVAVVRQALAGLADALAFDANVVADMKMAVSEACTNVVVHAYEGEEGTLEVEMLADEATLTIVVRDWGTGIQPRPHRREAPALGLGLPLIAALSDSFELRGSTNSGAEVRMTFLADRAGDPAHANPVTGTVGDDGFIIPNADACCRGCRLQWRREVLIARCNLMSQADRLLKHCGVSGFTERNKVLFIVIDEQHIFHRTL